MRLRRLIPLAVCSLVACKEEPLPAPAPVSSTQRALAATPIMNLAIAGELGFDLAPLADGALLVVADRDGGVSARLLDHEGAVRGKPLTLAPAADGKAFEVAAASLGTRLGVT
ncbi:MAG TPA: hypothetical protein VM686_22935, partial [Polyangiaceae bacterium]|nr:hypothetical protein [Polyangiaceae bacterium]